jgi:CO/xanthine dehydrogenase Mo-binding subunit
MEAREATATGESCMRVDAIAKVTGRARYTDDYVMAGMCYAKYVRSPTRLSGCRTSLATQNDWMVFLGK